MFFWPMFNPAGVHVSPIFYTQIIKIFGKNLTLGGHTFQDGQRGPGVLKRVLSSEF